MSMASGYAGYGHSGGNMMGYTGNPGAHYAGQMMGGYGGYGGWMHTWGGGAAMWIILLVVIGLIIYLIVASTRHHADGSRYTTHSESALDILKKRYAHGEISKEDFERMKRDIG
jgi:putative membrane protein